MSLHQRRDRTCMFTQHLPIHLVREGRDERQIGGPKAVLDSMRKTQTFRESKMMLLHKCNGLDLLDGRINANGTRHWFQGFHVYPNMRDVLRRIVRGDPISCFSTSETETEVHVAFTEGEHRSTTVSYMTLSYDTTRNFAMDTGVHFCSFIPKKEHASRRVAVKRAEREELRSAVVGYALMLPRIHKQHPYVVKSPAQGTVDEQHQFTLVYWDWEVLRCTDEGKTKGPVKADGKLFLEALAQVQA